METQNREISLPGSMAVLAITEILKADAADDMRFKVAARADDLHRTAELPLIFVDVEDRR
jgi:hypothetical protein